MIHGEQEISSSFKRTKRDYNEEKINNLSYGITNVIYGVISIRFTSSPSASWRRDLDKRGTDFVEIPHHIRYTQCKLREGYKVKIYILRLRL